MSSFSRVYYNFFSGFYDLVVRLHSKDDGAGLRDLLMDSSGLTGSSKHLDICTGTGSVALKALKKSESGAVRLSPWIFPAVC